MEKRVIIETFVIDKPSQVQIFEVIIPRDVERIVGVELGFNLLEGDLSEGSGSGGSGGGGAWDIPILIKRNVCAGELRLQSFSKANLFYAGEISLDRNIDNGDFTSQFFPPKVYTHLSKAEEVKIKLTSRNRMIRGIYRDKLSASITGAYKYQVKLYLWTSIKETKVTTEK